jgi:hypothetical protein
MPMEVFAQTPSCPGYFQFLHDKNLSLAQSPPFKMPWSVATTVILKSTFLTWVTSCL